MALSGVLDGIAIGKLCRGIVLALDSLCTNGSEAERDRLSAALEGQQYHRAGGPGGQCGSQRTWTHMACIVVRHHAIELVLCLRDSVISASRSGLNE